MDRGRLAIAVVYAGIILSVVLVGVVVALVWKMLFLWCLTDPVRGLLK